MLAVLDTLTALDAEYGLDPTVRLAAFFHDAVYDPTASDNEERSAELAEIELGRLGINGSAIATTLRLIRATDGHETDGSSEVDVFLDADLAILGTEPEVYDRYASAIRQEYAHLSDDEFRSGRATVLQKFLDRPTLFFTPAGQQRFEQPARNNLARELHLLQA